MSHRAFRFFAASLLLSSLAFGSPVHAAPASGGASVLFILDSSGSMWEKVDGQPKTVTAKKVLNDVLKDLPADTHMGLMTYGARRKGDCDDIQLLSAIGSESAAGISAKVNALQPKGETPIAGALKQSADAFKGVEGRKMIVLVTDGAEECKGDPCAAAKDLMAQGLDVHINVVGFHLAKKQSEAVECVAREGQGKYFDAKDVKTLKSAMTEVKAEVVAAAPVVVAAAEPPAPPAPPPPPPEKNLLAADQGGQMLVAPDQNWPAIVDGKDNDALESSPKLGEAVFSFKGDKPATFSKFEIYIGATSDKNIKDFEIFAGDESPTGAFRSLGQFTTENARMMKSPYQAFTFPETTAKYFKFKVISSYNHDNWNSPSQIRLIGTPAADATATVAPAADAPGTYNLLAADKGGQMLVAPDASWSVIIDGNDAHARDSSPEKGEVVLAFKDEKPATFSKFEIYIGGTWDKNIKDFEILAADDSPTGTFRSLGQFTTVNARMIQSPYQAFTFPETTAKYLKFKVLSAWGGAWNSASQIRLIGKQ